jgi:hypothetical protein
MIEEDAAALSTTLGITVYYGFFPDEADGSLDEVLALSDFALWRPDHAFGRDEAAITPYGIAVHARASTQAAARSLCQQGYDSLLAMGYLAISPVVSMGRDQGGRFEAVAEVEAHAVS